VSSDAAGPLRLANLVVIDTLAGQVVQTVNLAWEMPFQGQISAGGPIASIPQSLPAMTTFVPDGGAVPTGTVYVAMSNGAGTSAGLGLFYPGTVQAWRADFSQVAPLQPETAGKGPHDATATFVTGHYNPVALTTYIAGTGRRFVLATLAGASKFAGGMIQPTTDAHVEFLDHDAGTWHDAWDVTLGGILPSGHRIAVGEDAAGLRFGLLGSQTFAAVYLVDLTGLESDPVDPAGLRLLRAVDLEPGGSQTVGSAYVYGAALSFTGKSAVLTRFNKSMLVVLGIPDDVEFGTYAVNPPPFDTATLGPAQGLGIGTVLIEPDAPVFFVVNGNFDQNFVPNRNAFVGTLAVRDGLP
jgi:hypothetical protein